MVCDIILNRRDARVAGVEDGIFQPLSGEFREESLHRVHPGRRGWRDVEGPVGVVCEPGMHASRLVGGQVVEDDMDLRRGSQAGGHMIKEGAEIRGAVARGHLSHPLPGRDIQRRQPGGGAIPLIVMGAGGRVARSRGPGLLGPPQGLDLGLFVPREDNGMIRWICVQPDDIMGLDAEAGVIGDLEGLDLMGAQAMVGENPMDGGDGETLCGRQLLEGPVAPVGRRRRHRAGDQGLHRVFRDRGLARRTRGVGQQPIHPRGEETVPPAPDGGLAGGGAPLGLGGTVARIQTQNDPRPTGVLLPRLGMGSKGRQARARGVRQCDGRTYNATHGNCS